MWGTSKQYVQDILSFNSWIDMDFVWLFTRSVVVNADWWYWAFSNTATLKQNGH